MFTERVGKAERASNSLQQGISCSLFSFQFGGFSQPQKPEKTIFPRDGSINAHGFIFIDQAIREALRIDKGKIHPITIDKQDDLLIVQLKK